MLQDFDAVSLALGLEKAWRPASKRAATVEHGPAGSMPRWNTHGGPGAAGCNDPSPLGCKLGGKRLIAERAISLAQPTL